MYGGHDFTIVGEIDNSLYEDSAVRKAILLSRYVDFIKTYLGLRAAESNDKLLAAYKVRADGEERAGRVCARGR